MTDPSSAVAGSVDPVVRLRDATVGYEGRPVLSGIDFTMHRGEVVAVLGPNGSGKSTLVRGLLGLAPVLGGSIELFGSSIDRLRDRHRIGYVPQRHTVATGVPATVREVVAAGRLSRHRPWQRFGATDDAAIRQALGTVGLAGRGHDPVATLSGGQQRRVLIARALAAEPELLILDEPTAGVDLANQRVLTETLATLAARGTTTLIVAHELGPIEPLITRVVIIRDGHITYDGPPVAGQHDDESDYHHPHGEPPVGRYLAIGGPGDAP